MNIKRRRFIQVTSLTAASIPFVGFARNQKQKAHAVGVLADKDSTLEMFINPQNHHRPFVRWWWNGDRVTKEEVVRELGVMQDAGIGGVEINPIKWNENADAIGIKELVWGSNEWLDVVEAAVIAAKQKGMVCDMIVGSGWPFGGEHVPREDQSQIVILGTKNLEGGKKFSLPKTELISAVAPPSNYENKISKLFMIRLAPAEMNEFVAGDNLNSQLTNNTIEIDVPAGNHVLYYLVKYTGFQSVIQGALGAKGPVINHYQQSAVENYLNHFGDILTNKLGPLDNYFRAFFTDSIELEGANWCNDMFEQFKQRKGYGLEPYFPYILFKVGEMGNAVKEQYGSKFSPSLQENINRVRYDFLETKQQLFQERFVGTFTAWCTKHGVKSRMQAYGMDCNTIEASMKLDIPECETWIWVPEIDEFDESENNFSGRNYTMANKFVSSAAHLSGKQEISCEEMTSTGQIFLTTLERVKLTGDQSNLSGVTHSILHGFNYTPMEAPFPGWLRYGSFFNERNTWWPYFRLWSDYKSRMSSLFMNSVMQANIAVLHPLADLASKYGFQRDPFPNVSYPPYVHKVWEAIHQNGNGCDYVTEHIIQQAGKASGELTFNTRGYNTLMLIEVETMMPETAIAIKQFADAGGKIIFIGKTPHQSSGLVEYEKRSKEIAGISSHILKHHIKTAAIVASPGNDLIGWFKNIQQKFSLTPYVNLDEPVNHINQLYYKSGDRDIFYFTNYSAKKTHTFQAAFANKKTAWVWNAESGERLLYPVGSDGNVTLHFNPSESKLIVFDNDSAGENFVNVNPDNAAKAVVKGPWQVTLRHVNDTTKKITLNDFVDFQKRDDTKNFAGTIEYRTVINLGDTTGVTLLTLGHINDVSELEVNGQQAGTKWYGIHTYNITKFVHTGDNYITIKVVTTLGAYTKSLKNNKAAQEWSWGDINAPVGLVAPVEILSIKK